MRRTHADKLNWPQKLVDSFQREVRVAFPKSEISGYEGLVPSLTNHPKDRHVLAAAIRGDCPLILTFNLKHFSDDALEVWGVHASHPQDYLLILFEMEPKQVIACLGAIAGRRGLEIEDVKTLDPVHYLCKLLKLNNSDILSAQAGQRNIDTLFQHECLIGACWEL